MPGALFFTVDYMRFLYQEYGSFAITCINMLPGYESPVGFECCAKLFSCIISALKSLCVYRDSSNAALSSLSSSVMPAELVHISVMSLLCIMDM